MDKLILTGKVSHFEHEINDLKIELQSIKDRLNIAYNYKDNLFQQQIKADENIKNLQLEYFQKMQQITSIIDKIKNEFKIYSSILINDKNYEE